MTQLPGSGEGARELPVATLCLHVYTGTRDTRTCAAVAAASTTLTVQRTWKAISIGTRTSDEMTISSTYISQYRFSLESGNTIVREPSLLVCSQVFCFSSRRSRSLSSFRILISSFSTSLSCVRNVLRRSSRVSPARFISSSFTFASFTTAESDCAIVCFGCVLRHSSTTFSLASFHLPLHLVGVLFGPGDPFAALGLTSTTCTSALFSLAALEAT